MFVVSCEYSHGCKRSNESLDDATLPKEWKSYPARNGIAKYKVHHQGISEEIKCWVMQKQLVLQGSSCNLWSLCRCVGVVTLIVNLFPHPGSFWDARDESRCVWPDKRLRDPTRRGLRLATPPRARHPTAVCEGKRCGHPPTQSPKAPPGNHDKKSSQQNFEIKLRLRFIGSYVVHTHAAESRALRMQIHTIHCLI